MASDNECGYEEEWEDEEASVSKKNLVSSASGQIHPLQNDACNDTQDTEAIRPEAPVSSPVVEITNARDRKLDMAGDECGNLAASVKTKLSFDDKVSVTSQSTRISDEVEVNTIADGLESPHATSDATEAEHLLDIVRVYGRHYSQRALPPPGPVTTIKVASSARATKALQTPDFSALHAHAAAKRIAEYRQRQLSKEEEARTLESAAMQLRRQVRRSNEAMHKALGVAGLSSQDHLRLAQRRRLREMKNQENTASLERQNRWYNSIPNRLSSAPQHIQCLHRQYSQIKHGQERRVKLQQKTIDRNQAQLKEKAKAIISQTHGSYVRGSYLLKVTHHTIKSQAPLPVEIHEGLKADE